MGDVHGDTATSDLDCDDVIATWQIHAGIGEQLGISSTVIVWEPGNEFE